MPPYTVNQKFQNYHRMGVVFFHPLQLLNLPQWIKIFLFMVAAFPPFTRFLHLFLRMDFYRIYSCVVPTLIRKITICSVIARFPISEGLFLYALLYQRGIFLLKSCFFTLQLIRALSSKYVSAGFKQTKNSQCKLIRFICALSIVKCF